MRKSKKSKQCTIEEKILSVLENILIELHGNREMLSMKDATSYFGVSSRSIRRLINSGAVLAIKLPGIGLRISRKSLNEYADNEFGKEKMTRQEEENYVKTLVRSQLKKAYEKTPKNGRN
jgi:excisionase family DNA binding protein